MWFGFRLQKDEDNVAYEDGETDPGDMSDEDLANNGGKLQPQDGPRFKRKLPPVPSEM